MVNVLVINHNLVIRSGITMVIKNLIENSDRSVIKYYIVTGEDERNNVEYFEGLGVEVRIMPRCTPLSIIKVLSFFKNLFSSQSFDVVHSHFCQLDNLIFPLARRYGVKKCISHSHSAQLSESKVKAAINKLMCSGLANRADYCLACSNQAGVAVFGKSFPHLDNCRVVNNGIDCEKFAFDSNKRNQLRKEYEIQDDCIVVGHTGRFSTGKNQKFLIDIHSILKKRGLKYMLFLIGDGETKTDVQEKVVELQLQDSVIFAGGRDNINEYLNAFDIFIMPSIHEGLGISAIEAQANGLECILSTAIPKEANLTGVVFLDLNEPVTTWADVVQKQPKMHHADYKDKVIEFGYDIKDVGKRMTDFYVNICNQ